MIRVLHREGPEFSIYMDPVRTFPVACIAKWRGGMAMVELGTWVLVAGDIPPSDLLVWIKLHEGYLWDAYYFYSSI